MLEESGLCFDEIFEADSGRSAVRVASQHSPEIILMDIRMPGLDGISAAKQICDFNSTCKILFLTAYDHFEYAREALRCKASDFLVKPVSREELIKAVKTCSAEINQYIRVKRRDDQIRQELFCSIEEFLVNELVSGTNMSSQKLWSKLGIISPVVESWFDQGHLPNVCIVFKSERQLPAKAIKKVKSVKVRDASFPLLMEVVNDQVICLAWVPESGGEAKNISIDVATALAGSLFGPDGAGLRAGIGNVCSDPMALRQSYAEACKALDHGMVAAGKTSEANIIHIDNIDENRIFSRPYKAVQQIINYLEKNYDKKISLEEVAHQVYLNPVYLSTIIKQETGYTFSDYLTLIRMEKAKKMLASSLPIKEVARAVGYPDSNYFCRVFKRVTGVTATGYRKKMS